MFSILFISNNTQMRHIKHVNLETAQKLKEKGFNEDCEYRYIIKETILCGQLPKNNRSLAQYVKDSVGCTNSLVMNKELENNETLRWFNSTHKATYTFNRETNIAAPTVEQVINWLRIEKNIHLVAIPDSDGIWYSYVYDVQTGLRRHGASAKEYYEAIEAELTNILKTVH